MTEHGPTTDEAIVAMLLARTTDALPTTLSVGIMTDVAADPPHRRASRRRWTVRGGRRTMTLLAAAALLLAVGGGVLVMARPTEPEVPSTPGPSAAVLATAAPSPDPSLQPGRTTDRCPEMDAIADAATIGIDRGPLVGAGAPAISRAGEIVAVTDIDLVNGTRVGGVQRVDAFAPDSTLASITPWRFDTDAVIGLVPSPDGSALALAFRFYEGPQVESGERSQIGCADVFVLATDGSTIRRPFDARRGESFVAPSWSPDGRRLAALRWLDRDGGAPTASVVVWDRKTDTIVDLGAPCPECAIAWGSANPFWSADGSGIVAEVPGGQDIRVPAGRYAVDVRSGRWAPFDGPGPVRCFGSFDEPPAPCDSPDGTMQTEIGNASTRTTYSSRWWISVVDKATRRRTEIPSPIGRLPGNGLRWLWSPDSRWLAIHALNEDTEREGLWLAAADGSTPARQLIKGVVARWTWLPAAP